VKQPSGPIEAKVVTSSWTAMVVGLVTWGLVTFIPAWHSGIPQPLATFLPLVIASISSTFVGYMTKHTPRTEEVMKAAFDILSDPAIADQVEELMHQPTTTKSADAKSVG
jgi:hypothetical protein